jgi:hypothetical protein
MVPPLQSHAQSSLDRHIYTDNINNTVNAEASVLPQKRSSETTKYAEDIKKELGICLGRADAHPVLHPLSNMLRQ